VSILSGLKFTFNITQKHKTVFTVNEGYEVMCDTSFYKVIGLEVSKNVWQQPGNYIGTQQFYSVDSLQLYCKQLDDKNNFLNGKESKLMLIFPLNTSYKFDDSFTYHYESPTYLPLSSSTDMLNFSVEDGNGEMIMPNIIVEFLIKENGKHLSI
jgi:hypothetical protein